MPLVARCSLCFVQGLADAKITFFVVLAATLPTLAAQTQLPTERSSAGRLLLDRPVDVRFGAPSDDGTSLSKAYVCEMQLDAPAATVYFRASSQAFDCVLEVKAASGEIIGKDKGLAGRRPAVVSFRVEADRALEINVSRPRTDVSGEVRIEVMRCVETQATLAASEQALSSLAHLESRYREMSPSLIADGIAHIVDGLIRVPGATHSASVADVLWKVGQIASKWGHYDSSRVCWESVVDFRVKFLPANHRQVQVARANLAVSMAETDEVREALAMLEGVQVTLQDIGATRFDVITVSLMLAKMKMECGDLDGARPLMEGAISELENVVPPNDERLLNARANLGVVLFDMGLFEHAIEQQQVVYRVRSQCLPPGHLSLQRSMLNLGNTLKCLGRASEAVVMLQRAVARFEALLPENHVTLQLARISLGSALALSGSPHKVRPMMERALKCLEEALPDGHSHLIKARAELGSVMGALGDYQGQMRIQALVVEAFLRDFPPNHIYVLRARLYLARAMAKVGDLRGARSMMKSVLAIASRTLPEDHALVSNVRNSLANTLARLGERESALILHEEIVRVLMSQPSASEYRILMAEMNLALIRFAMGQVGESRQMIRDVVNRSLRLGPDRDDFVRAARVAYGAMLAQSGDEIGAKSQFDLALESAALCLPMHDAWLGRVRALAVCATGGILSESELDEAISDLRMGLMKRLSVMSGQSLPRDVAASVVDGSLEIDSVLSWGADHADSLELIEAVRGVEYCGYGVAQQAYRSSEIAGLREAVRRAGAAIVRLARSGCSRDELVAALGRKRECEMRMESSLRRHGGMSSEVLCEIVGRLGKGEVGVAYWRYEDVARRSDGREESCLSAYLAFVVFSDGEVVRVRLGTGEVIEGLVELWRRAVTSDRARGEGLRELGCQLRRAVLDPILAVTGESNRIVVATSGVTGLVPFDALPSDSTVVGDEVEFVWVPSLLPMDRGAREWDVAADLLVLGGIDYDLRERRSHRVREIDDCTETVEIQKFLGVQRGVSESWRWERGRYRRLPKSRGEAQMVASLFSARGLRGDAEVLSGAEASKGALLAKASAARFLHISTHGFFAPESVPSMQDERPVDGILGFGRFDDNRTLTRGFSPLVLCGLALAGANRPGEEGYADGIITAEELACLDLSGCELAVLSACSTGLGELRRAGQGIASLREALHAAGARSAITSVWPVSDHATKELMDEFYRRLWVEKMPAAEALWGAKQALRKKRGPSGPYYQTRDWAGWVLSTVR